MTAFLYGEVCAGAGGMSRGLEAGGFTPAFHAEIAHFPRRVLMRQWPATPLLSDLAAISGGSKMRAWMQREFSDLTLLAGGTPCQDLSIAGKRAGLAGARSSLYFRLVRLWKVLGCPYILWENVAGALTSNSGADFAAVLSAIVGGTVPVPSDGWASAGVVAGPAGVAAWRLLDALWFGVPQRRKRVFVLGARAGGCDPAEVLLEPSGVRRHPPTRREAREGTTRGAAAGVGFQSSQSGVRAVEAFATLDANYGSRRHNGVLSFGHQNSQSQGDDVSHEVVAPLRTGTTPAVLMFDALNNSAGDTAHTLRSNMGQATGYGGVLAYDTTQVTSAANRSNPQAGDPCHPLAATAHAPLIVTGEVAYFDKQSFGEYAESGVAIPRRLMPIECERLMGWPDGWTDVPDRKGKPASDAARYKACGNGVVSSVAEWIAARLLAVHSAMVDAQERAA